MEKPYPRVQRFIASRALRFVTSLAAPVFCAAVLSGPAVAAPEAPAKPSVVKPVPFKAAVININTADAELLSELNGIGPAKAAAIIEHRKQHGPFKSVEQLADVKGIGDAFIEKNRGRITVR